MSTETALRAIIKKTDIHGNVPNRCRCLKKEPNNQLSRPACQVLELTPRSLGVEDAHLQKDQSMVQEAKEVFDLFDKVTSYRLY